MLSRNYLLIASAALLVLIAIILVVAFTPSKHTMQTSSTQQPTVTETISNKSGTSPAPSPGETTGNFATSIYKKNGYEIFPQTPSAQTKQILDPLIDVSSKSETDGSTTITVTTKKRGYGDVTVTIKPGYKAYYIDMTRNDPNADLGDNGVVVVDPQGNIVTQ